VAAAGFEPATKSKGDSGLILACIDAVNKK
jgi:hypothetical protein